VKFILYCVHQVQPEKLSGSADDVHVSTKPSNEPTATKKPLHKRARSTLTMDNKPLTWTGSVNFRKHIPGNLSEIQNNAIKTYMACLNEWQSFLNQQSLLSEMCLKPASAIPVVISAVGELSILADYFLLLIYRPAKSFHSNYSMNNTTATVFLIPELSSSLYIEEFLPLGVDQNSDVDLTLLKKRALEPKHWMCRNFAARVQAVTTIRRTCGRNTAIWLGGPDVCNALADYVASNSDIEFPELDVVTGLNGQIFVRGTQHPSAPLMAGMADQVVETTRSSLRLFRAVVAVADSKQDFSIEKVKFHLSKGEAQRLLRKQQNITWILETFSTVADPLKIG
jgi:hypothetical protein